MSDHVVVQRDEVNEPAVEWEEYEFADLCDITRGASPRPIHDWISVQGIPWLKIADASATQSRYITQTKERIRSEGIMKSVSVVPGDLILSNSATPGIPKFVGISACIHDGWLLLRNLRHLDKLYCYYLLLLERPRIVEQGSGTVFTNLKTDILKRHRVRVPPLPEQRAIAHILGTLDDKIELNRRMNETLEAMARALFKSWFVDFDPVRAKMEGHWRRGQSLPGLPAEHYDLFPDWLVDSVLGEIPEGWEVRALGTLLDDVIGGDWGKETPDVDHTEPVSIIRGTDLPALAEGGSGSVPLRFTTKKKAERRMLKDGDIIIEVSGGSPTQSTGRSLMMTRDVLRRFPGTVVCASFCRRFRPNSWRDGLLVSRHLDFLHSTGKMWDYQLQSTGIANFQTTRFLKEEMAIWPGEPLLTTFAEIVGPIVRQTSRNENMILAAQRETLIPKLVSGELRVAIG